MFHKPAHFRLLVMFFLLLAAFPWFIYFLACYFSPDPTFTPFGYEKSHDLLHHYHAARHLLGMGDGRPFVYVYPPLTAWFYLPLGMGTYPTAHSCWLIFNTALWGGSYLFYRRHFAPRFSLLTALLFLFFPPMIHGLSIGQNSFVSLWIVLSVGWALKQNREWLAGFLLGCLFYKPQLLLPLAALFLITRQFRVIAGSALGSLFWLLAGLLLCGWKPYGDWFRFALSDPPVTFVNMLQTGLYGAFQYLISLGYSPALKIIWLLLMMLLLSVFFLAKKHSDLLLTTGSYETFFLLVPLVTLVTPYFGLYDWTIALPALVVLASRLADEPRHIPRPFLSFIILCLPSSLYLFAIPVAFFRVPLLCTVSLLWLALLYGPRPKSDPKSGNP